jgi:hypothetical protein
MDTVAKNDPAVASGRLRTASTYQPMYVDALTYVEADADYSASVEVLAGLRPYSVSIFASLLGQATESLSKPPSAQTMSQHCSGILGRDLGHFNLEWRGLTQFRNAIVHSPCAFRSVLLVDAADTYGFTQTMRTVSDYVLGFGHDDLSDEMAAITYADVDYVPRPRRYLDVEVRIDQTATRVARRYTDVDAEVEIESWGP